MSTQINQYLIWGIRLPYKWHEEWERVNEKPDGFYEHFEEFMDDSAFDSKIVHKDGIFMIFDGCNGKFIFIGRVIAKSRDGYMIGDPPIDMGPLTEIEQELIRNSVQRNFNVTGDFKQWLVVQYR